MKTVLRLIYLQDNADEAVLVRRSLATGGIDSEILLAQDRAGFLAAIGRHDFDLILADYYARGLRGPEALKIAGEQCPEIPFIFLSDPIGPDAMLEAFRNGASDFVVQEPSPLALVTAIRRAVQESKDRRQRERNEQELRIEREVLAALTDAMATFLESGDLMRPNAVLLHSALAQTQSEFGFIGVVVRGRKVNASDATPGTNETSAPQRLRILAHEGLFSEKNVHPEFFERVQLQYQQFGFVELPNLDNLFGDVITRAEVVISNDSSQNLPKLPPGHPTIGSFLGVPIFNREKVVGMIGLANRKGGYTGSEQKTIEILVCEAGVLCDAYLRGEREKALEQSQREAQEALSKSETRFHLAARATNDVIWDWNIQTDQILPEQLFAPFGYTAPDEGNSSEFWLERIHPDDRQRIYASRQEMLVMSGSASRDTWSGEYRFRRKDDSYAEVFDRGYVIRDANRRAVRMVGAMTDMTDQRRLERARRESDERFRFMVEGVKDYAIFMLDPAGKIVNWNSGAQKMTGYTASEVLGKHFALFFPNAEVRQNKPQRLLEAAAAEGQFEEEAWRVRKDRTQYWADVLVTAVYDETNNLRGFANVVRDITERKYAEEVLRASEERTRLIVESAHDAFVSMDANGITTDWNQRAEKILGWQASEAIGRPMGNFVIMPAWLGLDGTWPRNGALPSNTRFETQAVHCDGHSFPVEVSITLIRLNSASADSAGYMFSAFLHDITERKRAEAMLRQLPGEILRAQELERKRVARELHDSVGQFLTLVKIRIQSVEQMLQPSAQSLQPSSAAVYEATVKARELLGNSIEEVRRIAHNLVPSELEDLGLVAALRNLCTEFSGQSNLKIKLHYSNIPDELPSELKLSVFRIVQEALTNIVKHSGATRAEVNLVGTPSRIQTTIRDNGNGFSAAQHRSVKSNASSMGLANMDQRAAFCGGTVKIETAPRLGTTLTVDIPIKPAAEISLPLEDSGGKKKLSL